MAEKGKSKPRGKWLRIAASIAASLLVLFALVILLVSPAIRWAGQRWLRKQGRQSATIKMVDLNLLTGEVGVHLLSGGKGERQRLEIGKAALRVDWWPLWKRRVVMQGFSLEDVDLDIRQETSKTISIGGLNLAPAQGPAPTPTPGPQKAPWGFSLGAIDMRNVRVRYEDPSLRADVLIKSLHVNPRQSWQPELPIPFDAQMEINGSPIAIEGAAKPFARDPQGSVALRVTNLSLGWIREILRQQGIEGVDGVLNTNAVIKGTHYTSRKITEAGFDGSLSLSGARIRVPAFQLHDGSLAWKGRVGYSATPSTQTVSVVGGIDTTGVRTSLTSQGLDIGEANLGWHGEFAYRAGVNSGLTLTGKVTGADLVVRDRPNSVTLAQLGNLNLNDARFEMPLGTTSGPMQISGDLALAKLQAELAAQGLGIAQSSFAWKGSLRMTPGNAPASLTGDLSLSSLTIRDLKAHEDLGQLDSLALRGLTFDAPSGFAAGKMRVNAEIEAKGLKGKIAAQGLDVSQGTLGWKGEFSLGEKKRDEIALAGSLSAGQLVVHDLKRKLTLFELDGLAIRDARMAGPEKIGAGEIRLAGARALQRTAAEVKAQGGPPFLLSLKEILLSKPDYQRTGAAADSVRLAGIDSFLVVGPQGGVQAAGWTPPKEANAPAPPIKKVEKPAVKQEEKKTTFTARVDRFDVAGDNRFVLRDESIRPPTIFPITMFAMHVEGFDTATPEKLLPIKLQARMGKYSDFSVQGTLAPLAAHPAADLKGKITEFDLPPFTTYSERRIGYRLRTGVMNADLTVLLKGGMVDSKVKVNLSRFDLQRLRKEEKDEFTQQLGLPVNTALALLRDSNNEIALSLPLKGNLQDPKVGGVAGIVRTALLHAVTMGVRALVSPLGMTVEVGSKLVLRGNAFAFTPVDFAPGKSELGPESTKYLKKMAGILRDRPGIRLTVSGMVTPADVRALQGLAALEAETQRNNTGLRRLMFWRRGQAKTAVPVEIGPEAPQIPRDQLLELAVERGNAVKDYLTTQEQIDPVRLFSSTPTIEKNADAKPRAEMSL